MYDSIGPQRLNCTVQVVNSLPHSPRRSPHLARARSPPVLPQLYLMAIAVVAIEFSFLLPIFTAREVAS